MQNKVILRNWALARLYALPPSARDEASNDWHGWAHQHMEAVYCPKDLFERAVVGMLGGWLIYADAHRQTYGSGIGDDGVLGHDWAQIGAGLSEQLNGQLGRLDGGTLDGILCGTLREAGFGPE